MGFLVFGCFFYGNVIGMFAATIVNDRRNINAVIPVLILPFFIVAGFFAQVKTITWPLKIVSYASSLRFAF